MAINLRFCVWSCHPVSEGGVFVCLRTREWHTGVARYLAEGAATFMRDNPIALQLLCDELLCELDDRCRNLAPLETERSILDDLYEALAEDLEEVE